MMTGSPALLPGTSAEERTEPEVPIACRRCGHAITSPRERIGRDGAHVHTRINPGGWVHELGCFAAAPGARVEGEATFDHTWFPGFAWRYARCGACGTHLGWRYEGGGETFFGLILVELAGA